MRRQRHRPGARQFDLAAGSRRLALLKPQRPAFQAEHATAERDGAGRDDKDITAGLAHLRDIGGHRFEPLALQSARAIDQQGGADLDDDAAIVG